MQDQTELLNALKIDRSAGSDSPPHRWIALMVAAMSALGLTGWFLLGNEASATLQTAKVEATTAPMTAGMTVLDATGYIVARRMATVSARLTGRVDEVLIEEGQRVSAGDVLARLDPTDALAQRQLASSQLAAARSRTGSIDAQLREAEASVERHQSLAAQGLVPRSSLDQAVAQRDSLRAQQIEASKHVEVAKDQLKIADIAVENTIVRAPFSGVVIAKSAQPGEIVSPLSAGGGFTRTGVCTIVDMDSLEIEVDVGESFIGRVQPKMPVEAVLNAYADWKIRAEVVAIIPTADRGKATVKVRIALLEKDSRIVPDMGVRVRFLGDGDVATDIASETAEVVVPAAAVTTRDSAEVAFVVSEGRAELRPLRLGARRADHRVVIDGLAAGDVVVLDPPADLHAGDRVQHATAVAD